MATDFQKQILKRANTNLRQMFPGYRKAITLKDIEGVYHRSVLSVEADRKTSKGTKMGYLTGIMYFAPANISGIEVCPSRSAGCSQACLFTAGRGCYFQVTRFRIMKTLAYHFDKARFTATLKESIRQLTVTAKNKGKAPVVRLNGTSDILWERNSDVMQSYPEVIFYDYSKIAQRFNFKLPDNYCLVYSLSESNEKQAAEVLAKGGNVAAVFRGELPKTYLGYPVVPGDKSDLRFLDPKGVIVGLYAKGKARKDTSGFVKDAPRKTWRSA